MDREDRQFEMVLDSLIQRSQDLMKALQNFLIRIDTEPLEYNHYADAFAAFQGHIQTLLKVIRSQNFNLSQRTIFPLKLLPHDDEILINSTEGRLRSLNHDSVPIYLRTKLEPDLETRIQLFTNKGNSISNDQALKQIQTANKISTNMVELIRSHREEWENSGRNPLQQSFLQQDTYLLSAAILMGKGLRPGSELLTTKIQQSSSSQQQQMAPTGVAPSLSSIGGQQRNAPGKAQPSIKTNIKAATSIHPYR